ncbi:MAG: ABC transporter substrate-binding protein [Thaumarchaeota archaeon]|nr:ABC transporter substrate-binding protein [Candidatus Calditenuaceae archaeon]MDW8186742.1 ABC transporter substrate-binding protein [Nitrososphaerota archaeon]
MRVVSLVPSVTESLYALGMHDEVVGITYACPNPEPNHHRRVVVRPVLNTENMGQLEIDNAVREHLAARKPLYEIDYEAILNLRPDLIVVQDLCHVCAVTPSQVQVEGLPRTIAVAPKTVNESLQSILELARLVGREAEGKELVERLRMRLDLVRDLVSGLEVKRTLFMEWCYPPFCGGHWVPEMVSIAGGRDFGVPGVPSRMVSPPELISFMPEVVVVGPCGFNLERSRKDAESLNQLDWFRALPAFARREVYAVDAKRYFSGHGPSIAAGVEVLAEVIHGECVRDLAPEGSYTRVTFGLIASESEGKDLGEPWSNRASRNT